MKNKKILALLLACTITASGVPVYAADFSDGTAESVPSLLHQLSHKYGGSDLGKSLVPVFPVLQGRAGMGNQAP